jgi:electron transfer flavoprotein alpha subunit
MSDVLAVAEHRQGELRDVSGELVTAGQELTDSTGGALHLAIINGAVEEFADDLSLDGVDTIHTVDHGEEFNHDVYLQTLTQLYDELDPEYVVTPHTVNGMDYAPALAAEVDLPLAPDVIDFTNGDGLTVTREQYGGKVETTIDVAGDGAVVTVRPTEWSRTETAGEATVEAVDAGIDDGAVGSTVTGFEAAAMGDIDISEAEFIVSVGRGIEEEENLDLIEDLADALDATFAASRPIVDNGWVEPGRQVGQSGKVVTPDVYIAIGISGAVQHVAGMKTSDTIVAINTDPDAPIFDIADYGIVDDLFDVVPQLIEQFE